MRMEPDRRDWSDWKVRVSDDERRPVFDLPFADVG
jgi:hypothetical protein